MGQSCFVSKIAENSEHYKNHVKEVEEWKKNALLNMTAQTEKISWYLEANGIGMFYDKYLEFLDEEISQWKLTEKSDKCNSLAYRLENTLFWVFDGSDIQKKDAFVMEKVWGIRDWSKWKFGKWYWIEGGLLVKGDQIMPLSLEAFSPKDSKYMRKDSKYMRKGGIIADNKMVNIEIAEKNSQYSFSEDMTTMYDRGYDSWRFLRDLLKNGWNFIVRWVKTNSVIEEEHYNLMIGSCTTNLDYNNLFETCESFKNRLVYNKIPEIKWYSVAFKKVVRKGSNYDEDRTDVVPLNLVVVKMDDGLSWIKEDVAPDAKTVEDDMERKERILYFYTNIEINSIEDAFFIFLAYLKRRKIECWFRYLKQVFWLEKVAVIKFQKTKNLCKLLTIATYFLYKEYYDASDFEYGSDVISDLEERLVEDDQTEVREEIKQEVKSTFQQVGNNKKGKLVIEEICLRALMSYLSGRSGIKNKNYKLRKMLIRLWYILYIKQKKLTKNPDSFAKFINDLLRHEVIYY